MEYISDAETNRLRIPICYFHAEEPFREAEQESIAFSSPICYFHAEE